MKPTCKHCLNSEDCCTPRYGHPDKCKDFEGDVYYDRSNLKIRNDRLEAELAEYKADRVRLEWLHGHGAFTELDCGKELTIVYKHIANMKLKELGRASIHVDFRKAIDNARKIEINVQNKEDR